MIFSQVAKRLLKCHLQAGSGLRQNQQQLTFLNKYTFNQTERKQDYEKNNHYLHQMKNNLIQENDFDNKFKQEKNLIFRFIRKRTPFIPPEQQAQQDQNNNSQQQSRLIQNKRNKKHMDKLSIIQQQIEFSPQQVLKMHHLLCVAYMLKKDIKPEENLNIYYFYKNDFKESDQYQSIVRTLRDLTEKDLQDFILYTISVIFKEQALKFPANQKFDIVNNLIQLDLHEHLSIYIKQIILSIDKEEFNLIKAWKPILTLKLVPKMLKYWTFRDMDYINEQLSNILINRIKSITPVYIIEMCETINQLCQVNSRAPYPFKTFLSVLQSHVIDLLNRNENNELPKKANEIDVIVKKPKFIMNLIKVIKYNQDINPELVEKMENILVNIKPHFNHFKSHMLFFNSLSVINSGEKLLNEITRLIQDKTSDYYKEASNYDIRYILKLMYNEQLLLTQKNTLSLWKNNQVYKNEIEGINLFTETPLFISFDEIVSQKINNIQDVKKLDISTQLIYRRLYGMMYNKNEKLHQIAEEHSQQNESLFSKESASGQTMNEFNSDVLVYMNQNKIEFEIEKYMGYRNCDIYIPSLNLVIELDGKYHHQDTKLAKDQFRNIGYLKLGYKLLEISILQWEIYRLEGKIHQVLDEQLNLFRNNPDLIMSKI